MSQPDMRNAKDIFVGEKVLMHKGLTTGQMIDLLKVGDEAEFHKRISDIHLVVRKVETGAIIVVKNGENNESIGGELVLNATVMSLTWRLYRNMVSFFDAMKAHNDEQKTITYHHDEELRYSFKHELDTGQFRKLSNDNLCLYELIEGKWTIDD